MTSSVNNTIAAKPLSAAPAPTAKVQSTYSPGFIASAEFAQQRLNTAWLIKDVITPNQPMLLAGPFKSLKSSIALDLAISVGTKTPFLGQFEVAKAHPVAVISGESGSAALQDTARRICTARGLQLENAGVHWSFSLPQLGNAAHRSTLKAHLAALQVKLAIIDPIYLCLLGGTSGVSASNLFEMGPLLAQAASACLGAGATPVFVRHSKRSASSRDGSPPSLEDMSWAGAAEFARQWIILSRRSVYNPHLGRHDLQMLTGGSRGHGGQWDVTIDEGSGDRPAQRTWRVAVSESQPHEDQTAKQSTRRGAPAWR